MFIVILTPELCYRRSKPYLDDHFPLSDQEFLSDMFQAIWTILSTIATGFLILLVGVKMYIKFTTGYCKSSRRLDGKTVIITGSNTGIGKATAMGLAERGARVILACRDLKRAAAAKDDIVDQTDNKNVVVKLLDLGSLKSVRDFADDIVKNEPRLDVLINNAAVAGDDFKITDDGLEYQMQVNQFGPFLLTNLLIDLLKKSAPSRILVVSSLAHKFGYIELDNLNSEKQFRKTSHYSNCKLANVLFANELAKRLEGTGITVNSLHPGAVHTELIRNLPSVIFRIANFIAKQIFKTPEEGAQTSIYLAVSEEVEGVTGKYFADCKEEKMSDTAKDEELGAKLWVKCESFVGLKAKAKVA